jgi:hypothetical protein
MPDDNLTLTLRLHDPKEKKDHKLSASWVTVNVAREDLEISAVDFITRYIAPNLASLAQLKLK